MATDDGFRVLSRRALMRAGALAGGGLTVAALLGCNDDGSAPVRPGATPTVDPTGGAEYLNEDLLELNDPDLPYPYVLPEPNETPQLGGIFKYGWNQDVATFDPTKSTSASTILVPNSVTNRLIEWQTNARMNPLKIDVQPSIAKSWEVSPDGLTLTFHLVGNAKFHNKSPVDGREFVAEDARLAYERYAAEGVSKPKFDNVASMTTPDDVTFVITLKRPQPDFLIPLASREVFLYPIEIADTVMMSRGEDFVGTGPMILTDIDKGERITFKQNPEYWGNKPLLDGMEYHVILDSAAQLAAFRTGQVDYVSNMIGNPGQAETLLDSNPDSQLHLQAAFYAAFGLALNLENPKFQDERVRRAFNMAVDRQAMIDILYQGLARPVSTMAWNFLFDEEPSPEQMGQWWHHDPAEARRMLDAAGAEDLEFEMVYYTYNIVENKNANELLADHLRQVGVTVRLNQLDVTAFNAQWGQKQYREAADGWPATGWEADTFFRNHLKSGSAVNRWNISDPQLDEWADQQSAELDAARRREILQSIWDRVMDMAYRIEKPQPLRIQVYQPWLRNYRNQGPLQNLSAGDIATGIENVWIDK